MTLTLCDLDSEGLRLRYDKAHAKLVALIMERNRTQSPTHKQDADIAALRRVEAGTAAIGMLLTPIIGVMASAVALGEPLLFPQLASLALVIAGVTLAVRR